MRVAELSHDGTAQPYPDAAWNSWQEEADAAHTFVRVNALRIGPDQRLWVVDTGAPGFGGRVIPGGVKIVVINPQTNRVSRMYPLDSVTSAKSYIDDLRFPGQLAYITDAGIPGLIVLDLESGNARRVLDHHHSTTDERPMLASGQVMRTADGKEVRVHADQLEVSPDGHYLYFQPCSGPLYRIETRFLDDASIPPAELAHHVERWVDTPTTGGTAIDAHGNTYLSDVNKRSILKITPAGTVTTLIQDSRLDWAERFSERGVPVRKETIR
jgi:Major royal jelly protein